MNVIAFPPNDHRQNGKWRAGELEQVMEAVAPPLADGTAAEWEVGATELGDPQFYLIGPPPDGDCILCVSRLGRHYVLEDGAGGILFEHDRLTELVRQVRSILARRRSQIVARVTVLWAAMRELFAERLEPMALEGEELLTHFLPQLAALA
jgi:hypothetical protein